MASNTISTIITADFIKTTIDEYLELDQTLAGDISIGIANSINAHLLKHMPKPIVPVATTKPKAISKAKSPGSGNSYSRFVKLASEHKKAAPGSPLNQALLDMAVVPTPRYGAGSPSQKKFEESGLDVIGTSVSLAKLFTDVQATVENRMSAAGVVWGLLSDAERKLIETEIQPLIA